MRLADAAETEQLRARMLPALRDTYHTPLTRGLP